MLVEGNDVRSGLSRFQRGPRFQRSHGQYGKQACSGEADDDQVPALCSDDAAVVHASGEKAEVEAQLGP